MPTNLTIRVNTGASDIAYGLSGAEFVEVTPGSDYLIFSNGSDVVADGESLPSTTDLNQAGIVLSGIEQVVPKCFLADISDVQLKEIPLYGNQNTRYVFNFSFDGETGTEPVLELWDNSNLDTINNYSLGDGTPANSWWKGVVTTDGLPGTDWTGLPLAGSSYGYFLWLNNEAGALLSAKELYCNLKIVIPATANQSGAETPVIAIKYTTN